MRQSPREDHFWQGYALGVLTAFLLTVVLMKIWGLI